MESSAPPGAHNDVQYPLWNLVVALNNAISIALRLKAVL